MASGDMVAPRQANNFAIFDDIIGTSKQCLGKRGRIYQIINVGRKRKYVIMWDDLSRSELTVCVLKDDMILIE